MSNENEFVASLNRVENLIDSNQQDLKREVESLIDRRFCSLKEEVNKLKCAHSALDQINNLISFWDDRRDLSDLPNCIRTILEGVTANNHKPTHHLAASQIGANVTVGSAVNQAGNELGTEEHVNGLDTNVPSTSTVNDYNLNESTNENEQVNYLDTVEPIPCSVYSSKDVLTSSSIIHTNIKIEDASEQQSVQICKRVKMEEDGQYITDSDSDCDCDECIYGIVKQEIKEEFDEIWQLDTDNGQSVQLWTQVKKEEESSDGENVEIHVAPNAREELNHKRNESLPEESNRTNQISLNDQLIDQQVNNGDHEPNEPANDGHNESQTTKQSKSRKRKRTLTTESSLLENSLTNCEVSSPGPMTKSKRTQVFSSLDRFETVEKASTALGVDLSVMDEENGGGGLEQTVDDDNETELGEEDGGHYRIKTVKLKCTEENCEDEIADRDELHDHLRDKHRLLPYRCLAVGCLERFKQWNGLGPHVKDHHWNISSWPCAHCTKSFSTHHLLYDHLFYNHFEGQFKCDYDGCDYDRVGKFRSQIKNHQRSVHPKTTNSTIYTCPFPNCGKTFNHKGNFNIHQRIHTGVKAFRCEWNGCDKSFSRKYLLNVHQRIHQNVKPFKCTWNKCDYASTQDASVITHIRTVHFGLPATQKEQRQQLIEDNRDPRDYLLNTTTRQSDH